MKAVHVMHERVTEKALNINIFVVFVVCDIDQRPQ